MSDAQLILFDLVDEVSDERSNGNGPTTRARGPRGLLQALVAQGLRDDALTAAAALILEMDATPIGER
jgi:hypothetical protein